MEWRCAGVKSRWRVDAVAVLCQNLAFAFLMVAGTVDVLVRAVAFLTSIIVGLPSGKQRSHQGQQNERGHGTPPKIPQVASIVVSETAQDEVSHERLVDLMFWCAQAGMRYLFVYDPKGEVTRCIFGRCRHKGAGSSWRKYPRGSCRQRSRAARGLPYNCLCL